MMPVGFMVSHHPLENCFDDFVDCFNLAVALGVLGDGYRCLNFNMVESLVQTTSSKCLPWSETNYLGTPNHEMTWLKKKRVVVSLLQSNVGMASAHFVKYSIAIMIY